MHHLQLTSSFAASHGSWLLQHPSPLLSLMQARSMEAWHRQPLKALEQQQREQCISTGESLSHAAKGKNYMVCRKCFQHVVVNSGSVIALHTPQRDFRCVCCSCSLISNTPSLWIRAEKDHCKLSPMSQWCRVGGAQGMQHLMLCNKRFSHIGFCGQAPNQTHRFKH